MSTSDTELDYSNYDSGTANDPVPLEYNYDNSQAADAAYQAWVNDGAEGFDDGGAGKSQSTAWSGSLEAPDEIPRGEAFTASATVENTSSKELTGHFYLLFFDAAGEPVPVAEGGRESVGAGSSADVSFDVKRGNYTAEIGATDLHVYEVESAPGIVASATVQTVEGAADTTDGWSTPQHVEDLPFGWYLFRQTRGDEERFLVVGTNADGQRVYLASGGEVQHEAAFFDTIDEVAQALEAFANRMENGEVGPDHQPDPSQPRPAPDELADDAAAATQAVARRRKLVLIAAVIIVAAGLYSYSDFDVSDVDTGDIPVLGGHI